MQYTSSQANKLLQKLNSDHRSLLEKESICTHYLLTPGESADDVRPAYNFLETQKELDCLERKIRIVKHAINLFNTQTIIPEFNITIDEMLVLLPQLSSRMSKLKLMKDMLPKQRFSSSGSTTLVEYRYANYDISEAEAEYNKAYETLSRAQLALDTLNNTLTFEIDI